MVLGLQGEQHCGHDTFELARDEGYCTGDPAERH